MRQTTDRCAIFSLVIGVNALGADYAADPRLEEILHSARVIPLYEATKFKGLKIDRIRSGQFFHLLGLIPGDVIQAYNGVPLRNIVDTSSFFDVLLEGKPYVIEVLRGGTSGRVIRVEGPPQPAA